MHAHNRGKLAVKVNGKKRYVEDPTKNFATYLLVGTIGLSLGVQSGTNIWNARKARASKPVAAEQVLPISTESVEVSSDDLVTNKKSGQSLTGSSDEISIEQIIEQVFGDQAENAKKIAMCESGMNPENVGDQHIMGNLNGEMVGDSVGLFQIRTGDAGVYDSKPWNRAKANGMSVEEFRTYLKNPENNVKYAKDIYERQGWSAWFNCMKKTGVR